MKHLEQGTTEWLAMRKNYIMASDAPVIMNGLHFKKTPYKLWKEKLNLGEEQKDNKYMRYGRETEPIARKAYEDYTGNIVKPDVVFHNDIKFMGASLDGLTENGDMAVEVKCTGPRDHATAQSGKVPEKYKAQVQHQMACLRHRCLHYYSFRDNEGILLEVERDQEYIEEMYKKHRKFWEQVINLTPPDLSSHDYEDQQECVMWEQNSILWRAIEKEEDIVAEKKLKCRETFIRLSGDHNSIGHGVRASHRISKGRVDYKAIPELKGLNLDKYRKKPIESWRIESCK